MQLIITCGCGDTTEYARTGWTISHHQDIPLIIEMNNENRPLIEMILMFFSTETRQSINLDEPFAFSISLSDKRKVYNEKIDDWCDEVKLEVFDLLNGVII